MSDSNILWLLLMQSNWGEEEFLSSLVPLAFLVPRSIVPSEIFINVPSLWSASDNQERDGRSPLHTTHTSSKSWKLCLTLMLVVIPCHRSAGLVRVPAN